MVKTSSALVFFVKDQFIIIIITLQDDQVTLIFLLHANCVKKTVRSGVCKKNIFIKKTASLSLSVFKATGSQISEIKN